MVANYISDCHNNVQCTWHCLFTFRSILPRTNHVNIYMVWSHYVTRVKSFNVGDGMLTLDVDSSTRGHPYKLKTLFCRSSTRKSFFTFRVVHLWNSLPVQVVTATSLSSFKSRIDRFWASKKFITNSLFPSHM